jgi:hypothetical protein
MHYQIVKCSISEFSSLEGRLVLMQRILLHSVAPVSLSTDISVVFNNNDDRLIEGYSGASV